MLGEEEKGKDQCGERQAQAACHGSSSPEIVTARMDTRGISPSLTESGVITALISR
jgi:hypothetical protein